MKFFTETFFDTKAGVLEFHFERVGYPSTTAYKVAVIAGANQIYNLIMQEEGERWIVVNASLLPDWIRNFEDALSDSICAHHKKSAAF